MIFKNNFTTEAICINKKQIANDYFYTYINLDDNKLYVMDNLNFKKPVKIIGDGNIIVKNCVFKSGLEVFINGDLTLRDIDIFQNYNMFLSALNIKLINTKLNDGYNVCGLSVLINLKANSVELFNSIVGRNKNKTTISLESNNLSLENSSINGDKVKCNSSTITSLESFFKADNLIIDVKFLNSIFIDSSSIIFNGEEIGSFKGLVNKDNLNRFELLNLLKKIKNKLEENTLIEYKLSLNKPISKVKKYKINHIKSYKKWN